MKVSKRSNADYIVAIRLPGCPSCRSTSPRMALATDSPRHRRRSGLAVFAACERNLRDHKPGYQAFRVEHPSRDALDHCLSVNTGHDAARTTWFVVDPNSMRSSGLRPRTPITIKSVWSCAAISRMRRYGLP